MQLALELALRRPRPPEDYRRALQHALEDVERLVRLVNDLLTLSRADSGHLEVMQQPVHLRPLLHHLLSTYQLQAKEQKVTLNCSVPEVVVRGDQTRLRQLFANLLDNALRYTPTQGQVSLMATRQNGTVYIAVVDTGPGIASEHLPHIFERFYRVDKERTREEGGSGLGLAICQEIVRAHGGSLTASSTPGQGSTFTVTLPLAEPAASSIRNF
jgi:signal transduction histidine kinase